MWFPNRSDTNQTVQSHKQARSLKFRIQEEEEVYCPCRENKGADQLRGFVSSLFSHMQTVGFLMRRLKCCKRITVSYFTSRNEAVHFN